jgi:hypothetical protein
MARLPCLIRVIGSYKNKSLNRRGRRVKCETQSSQRNAMHLIMTKSRFEKNVVKGGKSSESV